MNGRDGMEKLINDSCNKFIDYLRIDKRYSINTVKSYYYDLKSYESFLKNQNILTVTHHQILKFIEKRKEDGLNEKSIVHIITVLRGFYKFLLIEQLINYNPMDKIESRKIINR